MGAYKKGTEGWAKAQAKFKKTIRERYGEDYFKELGHLGGSKMTDKTCRKGFGTNRALAVEAGRKGGSISKRGPAKRKGNNV